MTEITQRGEKTISDMYYLVHQMQLSRTFELYSMREDNNFVHRKLKWRQQGIISNKEGINCSA
eukprot:scaffold42769_cov63-Attheya_sp.AAC.3